MIAHFLSLSVVKPKSEITSDEYESLGRQRNSHRLPVWVRLGSVPPNTVGMPDLRMVGEMACVWVLRIGPITAGTPSPTSLENARTVPGLVLPLSSITSSTCLPR